MRKFSARSTRKVSYTKTFWWRWVIIICVILALIYICLQIKSSIFFANGFRVNIALNTKPPMVVSLARNSNDKDLVFLFPENSYLTVPYGYGKYRIGSLWELSKLEKNPQIFTWTLADVLGIKIQNYVSRGNDLLATSLDNDGIIKILKKQLSFFSQIMSADSNLSWLDKIIISFLVMGTRNNQIAVYKLEEISYLFTESKLPDATVIKDINFEAMEAFIEHKFEEQQIRAEGVSVEIVNTTDVSGIGQKFSRILVNAGMKVIAVTNDVTSVSNCLITVSKANVNKAAVKYLIDNFNCEKNFGEENQTVDVSIKLGDRFGRLWPK